ncbi:MAG: flagellar protein FlaG [Thermodesulfobacteriota bacterium]
MDPSITSSDVKGYVVPSTPVVEQQKNETPQVKPVPENTETNSGKLDDQALHGKGTRQKKSGNLSQEELEEAIKEIQSKFDTMSRSYIFGFHKHEESESIVAQLTDRETEEIVRQIPSEEILELREKMEDIMGILFDKKV